MSVVRQWHRVTRLKLDPLYSSRLFAPSNYCSYPIRNSRGLDVIGAQKAADNEAHTV